LKAALAVFAILAGPAFALFAFPLQQTPTLLPVDEAVTQPDFFTFRANLQAIIARRDVPALLEVVDANIKNGFGGDDGIENFKKNWELSSPDSSLWGELGAVLALGGSFMGDYFYAPYTFSRWPSTMDSFEHVVVTASNVRVRAEPRSDAAVLTTVSFAILKASPEQLEEWTSVILPDNRKGFLSSRFVRSPIDYRAIFLKSGGRWQLTMFLAGD
jgi:hypothetical protein